MNRAEYLSLPEVEQFKEFLRSRLISDGGRFSHAYEMESRGRSKATSPGRFSLGGSWIRANQGD